MNLKPSNTLAHPEESIAFSVEEHASEGHSSLSAQDEYNQFFIIVDFILLPRYKKGIYRNLTGLTRR